MVAGDPVRTTRDVPEESSSLRGGRSCQKSDLILRTVGTFPVPPLTCVSRTLKTMNFPRSVRGEWQEPFTEDLLPTDGRSRGATLETTVSPCRSPSDL